MEFKEYIEYITHERVVEIKSSCKINENGDIVADKDDSEEEFSLAGAGSMLYFYCELCGKSEMDKEEVKKHYEYHKED